MTSLGLSCPMTLRGGPSVDRHVPLVLTSHPTQGGIPGRCCPCAGPPSPTDPALTLLPTGSVSEGLLRDT